MSSPQKVTNRVRDVFNAYVENPDVSFICSVTDLSPQGVHDIIVSQPFQDMVADYRHSLEEHLDELARDKSVEAKAIMMDAAPDAARNTVTQMKGGSNENARVAASKMVLATVGIGLGEGLNLGARGGIIFIPPEGFDDIAEKTISEDNEATQKGRTDAKVLNKAFERISAIRRKPDRLELGPPSEVYKDKVEEAEKSLGVSEDKADTEAS